MLFLFLAGQLACYKTYSAEVISGTWTISEFRFTLDELDLQTAVTGKTFQYTFGTPPALAEEGYDTAHYEEDMPRSSYEDSVTYSSENASDLWTLCTPQREENPSFYCPIMPFLLHKDQWLAEVVEDNDNYSEELCSIKSHYFEAFVISETELWTSEGFTLYCWSDSDTETEPPYQYEVVYNTRWTKQ